MPASLHIRDMLGIGGQLLDAGRFGISRGAYEAQLASYRPVLQSVARMPNATIFPLIDRLCDEKFCAGTAVTCCFSSMEIICPQPVENSLLRALSQEFARLQRAQK